MTTRRRFLMGAASAVAATGLTAVGRPARAADPITVITPFGFIPDFIEIMNANAGGYFAKQGIDAKIVGANGAAQGMQQLVAGQGQFGRAAGLDLIHVVGKLHEPLVSIATLYQGSTFQVVSLKDKPVTRGEDLKGKTVGIVSVGGTTDTFIDLILTKVGLPKDSVKREAVGNSPGAVDFIRQGRIDCFVGSLNLVVALERAGQPILYWSTDKYAPMPSQVYVATREIVDTKPELVTRFCRALKASVDEIMTQPIGPIYQRAAKQYDIPGLKDIDAQVAVEEAVVKQLWLSEGKQNVLRNVPHLWQSGVDEARQVGLTDNGDATLLYTNKFIDEAYKS